MAMRSVAAASWRLTGNRLTGLARPFSYCKGKVLSEEELAAEKIYPVEKEKMEKMKHKAEKEKAQKDREDEKKKA